MEPVIPVTPIGQKMTAQMDGYFEIQLVQGDNIITIEVMMPDGLETLDRLLDFLNACRREA